MALHYLVKQYIFFTDQKYVRWDQSPSRFQAELSSFTLERVLYYYSYSCENQQQQQIQQQISICK